MNQSQWVGSVLKSIASASSSSSSGYRKSGRVYLWAVAVAMALGASGAQAATLLTIWTDGAGDQMWSSADNWNPGIIPLSTTHVQIGMQPTGDQVGVDTGTNTTVASFTFNNTLTSPVDITRLNVETLQVNGGITNNSAITASFSLPVRAGASAPWSGPISFTAGVQFGSNTITLANSFTFGSGTNIGFDIYSTNSYGRFLGAGVATVDGATINIGGSYTGNGGDTFDFTSGNFTGATLGTLPTLSGGLSWNTNQFLANGILSVSSLASPQTITFPPIGNKVTTDTVGLAATASSGLEVSFAVASGLGEIDGETNLTFTGVGIVEIVASQAGDASWNAAPSVTNLIHVYALSANNGPYAGGNTITVTNGNFGTITNVLVGSAGILPASSGSNWFTITLPAATSAGAVDLIVQTSDNGDITLPNAYTYNPAGVIGWAGSITNWTEVSGLPAARRFFGSGSDSNRLLTFGGLLSSTYQNNTYAYDGTNWTAEAGTPGTPVAFNAGGTLHSEVYSIGGKNNSTTLTNVWKWTGTAWVDVAGLPSARWGGAAATLNDRLYFMAGMDAGNVSTTNVYAFDGTNWTEVASLPAPRHVLLGATLGSSIYAMGGYDDVGLCTNVYMFDGTSWTEGTPLPIANSEFAAFGFYNYLYTLGGYSGGTITNVYRFDGETWEEVPGLPSGRHGLGAAFFNGSGYAIAGAYDGVSQSNVYRASWGYDGGLRPASGTATGGFEVVIDGLNLGNGSDITNVTLCGVSVTNITSQSATQVVVWAGARAAATGDVVVFSTSYGMTTKNNGFSYTGETSRVVLYDFYMQAVNGGVSVCWQTASEEKTVGFDLYRWQDGAWVKVNGAFVYAQGVDGMGASYCVVDAGANATDEFRYKLVETESGGGTQEYGPFDVAAWGLRLDNVVASAEGVTIRWLGRAQDTYEIWKSVDLMRGFERLASGIAGVEPVTSFTDENAEGNAFYRIRTERE